MEELIFESDKPLYPSVTSGSEKPHNVFVFGILTFVDNVDIEKLDDFFTELKELFNTHHRSKMDTVYEAVSKVFQKHSALFRDSKSKKESVRINALIFSFCHFIQQSDYWENLGDDFALHVRISSCPLRYPLSTKNKFRLTKEYFKKASELHNDSVEHFTKTLFP